MLRRMAVEPSCTIRGSKEDGDAQIDTHSQPSHKDDITMDAATMNKIMDMIDEQQQSLEEHLENLSKELEAGLAQQETLKKNLLQLGREMDSISSMQRRYVEELCKVTAERRKSLESGHNIPEHFGMVAVYVEQAICAYVLPEVFSVNDVSANIDDLLNFLNGDDKLIPLDPDKYDCEGVISCARNKWETICKNFNFPDAWKMKAGGWTLYDSDVPGDIRAIEALKIFVGKNYPCPIHLKYAEEKVEAMKDKLPPWQFELVAEFIGSLRDKLTKTGLHHNYLHLD